MNTRLVIYWFGAIGWMAGIIAWWLVDYFLYVMGIAVAISLLTPMVGNLVVEIIIGPRPAYFIIPVAIAFYGAAASLAMLTYAVEYWRIPMIAGALVGAIVPYLRYTTLGE